VEQVFLHDVNSEDIKESEVLRHIDLMESKKLYDRLEFYSAQAVR
jgi:hypothetical protein